MIVLQTQSLLSIILFFNHIVRRRVHPKRIALLLLCFSILVLKLLYFTAHNFFNTWLMRTLTVLPNFDFYFVLQTAASDISNRHETKQ